MTMRRTRSQPGPVLHSGSMFWPWLECLSQSSTSPHPSKPTEKNELTNTGLVLLLAAKSSRKHTDPVNEEGLGELDHLQGDQQADGDQVVV